MAHGIGYLLYLTVMGDTQWYWGLVVLNGTRYLWYSLVLGTSGTLWYWVFVVLSGTGYLLYLVVLSTCGSLCYLVLVVLNGSYYFWSTEVLGCF